LKEHKGSAFKMPQKKKTPQKFKDEVVTTDEDDGRIGLGLQVGINPKQ
jgi:hypothetical protein